jgi:hypothetical protein
MSSGIVLPSPSLFAAPTPNAAVISRPVLASFISGIPARCSWQVDTSQLRLKRKMSRAPGAATLSGGTWLEVNSRGGLLGANLHGQPAPVRPASFEIREPGAMIDLSH